MLVEEYYDFEKEGIYRRGCEIKNVLPMIGSKSNFFSPASVPKGSIKSAADLYSLVKGSDKDFHPVQAIKISIRYTIEYAKQRITERNCAIYEKLTKAFVWIAAVFCLFGR